MDIPISPNEFDIISTIRCDDILLSSEENTRINLHVKSDYSRFPNRFYMLSYHQERMLASARVFGWDTSQIEGPAAYDRLELLLCNHLHEKYHEQIHLDPLIV